VATGELLAELVRAHFDAAPARFDSILNQVIAAEARAGHSLVAQRLRHLRETAEQSDEQTPRAIPLARPRRELAELMDVTYSDQKVRDLILDRTAGEAIDRVVLEQAGAEKLSQKGLKPTRKLLLHGQPGTGKTFTAECLAGELRLPLVRIRIEVLFSRYLGETAAALSAIFDEARRIRAVYLFDEFDSLGRARSAAGDVGEMSRVVSTFLQLLDRDDGDSLLVAATNSPGALDSALFRRFDDVIDYQLPDLDLRSKVLSRFDNGRWSADEVEELAELAAGLSMADIEAALIDTLKFAILSDAPVRYDRAAAAIMRRNHQPRG
jgi:SpoVK/Ycf46/Vps4 family AAA+-type ATPase